MGSVADAVRTAFDLILRPFDGLAPFWALIAASLITAVAILYVVRFTTPARWIERARSQIAACIYEVRLFLDSPIRVLRIQGRLLYWSGAYILALTPAFIVMTLPMGILFLQLDARFGFEPLPTRTPAVVQVDLDGASGESLAASAGDWGRVTAPPLHDAERERVYFRVAIDEPGSHELTISSGEHQVTKRLDAGPVTRFSPTRASGAALWWVYTDEPPLPSAAGIEAISVDQPIDRTSYLWMPWWLFWLVVSTLLALVLRRPLGVTL